MGASGSTTVDFGAFPGQSDASVDVVTAGVVAGSLVEAWLMPVATADHTVDEHLVETIRVVGRYLSDGNIRIHALNTSQLNEPVEKDPFNGAMIQNSTSAIVWRAASTPGPVPRGGGTGTRIYGLWTVGWVWN